MAYSDTLIAQRTGIQDKKEELEEKKKNLLAVKISKKKAVKLNKSEIRGKKYTELRTDEGDAISTCATSIKSDISTAVEKIDEKLTEYQASINSLTIDIAAALESERLEDERKRREALEND